MKKLFSKLLVVSAVMLFFQVHCSQVQVVPQKSAQQQRTTLSTLLKKDKSLIPQSKEILAPHRARKDWNFIVYFAANNNLHEFAITNIQQMLKVGSTQTLNTIIQLDELGAKEMTRYYIQKGSASPVFHSSNTNASISGTQESLYNFVQWTLQNYPANRHCLVLWNHGSGIKDPSIWGRYFLTRRNEAFLHNKNTGLLELNRKLSRQHAVLAYPQTMAHGRGIAFNDSFETYLTNQDLQIVLERISRELLNGKKLDILCMDACMMEMVEVGSQLKNAVNYMVGSEEVEPGSGYDYSFVLAPFERGTLEPDIFAKHIVQSYAAQYHQTHADYSQSAISTMLMPQLEENFAQITKLLTDLISSSSGTICAKIIRDIRLSHTSTLEFTDPDYIDFGKFYAALYQSLGNIRKITKEQSAISTLKERVAQGIAILHNMIVDNVAGSALNQATGLSFFFPSRLVHSSYLKTVFDRKTRWSEFLNRFLKVRYEQQKPIAKLQKHR
jgi:hypothetical protein